MQNYLNMQPLNLDVFFHLCALDPHLPYKLAQPHLEVKPRNMSLDHKLKKKAKFVSSEPFPFVSFNKSSHNVKAGA
jgi:hypothetical protein